MKKVSLLVGAAALLVACGGNHSHESVSLTNEIDSVSYSLGANMANNIAKDFSEANTSAFVQGFRDVLDSADMMIATEELQGVLQPFFQRKQEEAMKKQQEEAQEAAQAQFGDVKAEGEQFLEDNKSKEGVQVTASGLQYIVLKEGTGNKPDATTNVTVHYHGTTPDGTVFDSSVERGQPATFPVGGVIKGWTEALQLMPEGSKWKLYIPYDLAYGERGAGAQIGPYSTLIFDIELITIAK